MGEHAGNGDSKGELLCLTKALSFAPEDETVVYRLARCYARLDMTEKAMEYYRKAVELNPGDPANQIGMGTALLNAGKIALSVAGHIHAPFQKLDTRGYGELVVGSLTKRDILREITFDAGVFTVRDLTSDGQPRF